MCALTSPSVPEFPKHWFVSLRLASSREFEGGRSSQPVTSPDLPLTPGVQRHLLQRRGSWTAVAGVVVSSTVWKPRCGLEATAEWITALPAYGRPACLPAPGAMLAGTPPAALFALTSEGRKLFQDDRCDLCFPVRLSVDTLCVSWGPKRWEN